MFTYIFGCSIIIIIMDTLSYLSTKPHGITSGKMVILMHIIGVPWQYSVLLMRDTLSWLQLAISN
jgi:hypothetical protein